MTLAATVLILSQPSETVVTALTLRHLVHDADPTTTIHVLMNGGFVGELREIAPRSPKIGYHASPTNLGVAGGRNFLLRLPEVREADVIVILDNDVITPPTHVARLVNAVARDPEAGVIGPAILNLHTVGPSLGLTESDLHRPITNERLTRLGRQLREETAWFHLGAHPNWEAVYFDELRVERLLMRHAGADVDPFPEMNHQDPAIRVAVAGGASAVIPASNVAGCCQAFRRELLDEIGYLTDEFSPYGYEDVEFCIRAATARRRNYIDPSILMLHGTDRRHLERRTREASIAVHRNFMRCKSLLAWRNSNVSWPTIVERSILRRYLLDRQLGRHRAAVEHLHAHVAGSLDARRQIQHALAHDGEPR
jgi:GT2 family glycosyltransferase